MEAVPLGDYPAAAVHPAFLQVVDLTIDALAQTIFLSVLECKFVLILEHAEMLSSQSDSVFLMKY